MIMATIQELLDDENVETGDIAQLVTVVQSQQATIAAQAQTIADLQANAGQLTPEQQATLDATNAAQKANEATLESLLPPAPTP
jgi:multidrug resistance efflux pump